MITNKFNVRVYGLLINEFNEVLLTDEEFNGFKFTKFPGGGLEIGEGTIDAIKREFIEECNLKIDVIKHYYTTDFYVKSLFSEDQLISIYYLVRAEKPSEIPISTSEFDFELQNNAHKQSFRWKKIKDMKQEDLTFPVDKHVLILLSKDYSNLECK